MSRTDFWVSFFRFASLVGRSLIIGVGFAIALMIGGMTMNILGLPLPSLGAQPKPFQSLISSLLGGTLIGLTLGPLAARINLPLLGRACLWTVLLLVLSCLINLIEAVFFTTIPRAQLASSGVILAFGHIAAAVLLALLFRPPQTGPGPLTRLSETLAQRTVVSWAWRFGLAALSYLPIYYLFGMIVAPFVLPYYDNPEMGLNLTVPSIGIILPLEIGRGLLFALILFPLIAVLRGRYWPRALAVGLTIAVLSSWVPMIQAIHWIPVLRLAHGLEITADAFAQGIVLTWLLSPPDRTNGGLRSDHPTKDRNLLGQRIFPVAIVLPWFLSSTALGDNMPCRAYFIGNSVTDTIRYNSLARLAESRGRTLTWGRDMIPGAPLSWIWEHPRDGFHEEPFGLYSKALTQSTWDVQILQPFDRHLEGKDGDLAMATSFIDLALKRSPNLQVYVYSRWPRRDKAEDGSLILDYKKKWLRKYTGGWDGTEETRDYFERVVAGLRKAYQGKAKPVLMVPVGDVLLELDERMRAGQVAGYSDIAQVYVDGIHFNNVGSFIVGLTFYATLFQDDPRGLSAEPYNEQRDPAKDRRIDSKLALAIQDAVWTIVSAHPLAGVHPDLAFSIPPVRRSYSTRFEVDEDPISEGGKWVNGGKDGLDWYNVITKNRVAYGAVTQGDYTDPTALLSGTWGKNQRAKARVFSRNQTEKYYQEVEIRLRSTLTPHHCTGYEVFWRCLKTPNAYVEIVRWNGKVRDWTSLKKLTGAKYGVKDGDLVEASIVGNVIKGYVNGMEVISTTDDTFKEGNPGMGFNYGVGQTNGDFGFKSYEVESSDE